MWFQADFSYKLTDYKLSYKVSSTNRWLLKRRGKETDILALFLPYFFLTLSHD